MLEFDACVGGSEVPVGLGVMGIAVVLPGGDFIDEGLFVGDAAVEALGRQDAETRKSAFQRVRVPRHSATYFFTEISFAAMIASAPIVGDKSESLNPFKLVEAGD
jgi:hypothetical protein